MIKLKTTSKEKKVNNTKLINTGYLKLDYVSRQVENKSIVKNSILLAHTLSTVADFNISFLADLIDEILKNSNLNLIYRPHPRDLYDLELKKNVEKINNRFSLNKKFFG